MRGLAVLGLLLVAATGACFEESNPVGETGAMQSSGEDCIAGTEGCPCIEGDCVGELECYSNVCVDAGATSQPTDGPEDTTVTSTTATATTNPDTTVGTTPMTSSMTTDEPPDVSSDVSGGLPQGAACDPFFDLCEGGLACVGLAPEGLYCDVPGMADQGLPCEKFACGPGLLCIQAKVLSQCMSMVGCCTAMCDLNAGMCPPDLTCEPFYPMGMAPPGYEHVGVCLG